MASPMDELKRHYFFSDEDSKRLQELLPLAEQFQQRMVDEFYEYIISQPETAAILAKQSTREKMSHYHRLWFLSLFKGSYDDIFLENTKRIGYAHVRVGLPINFVNASMHQVRHFLHHLIHDSFSDRDLRRAYREAADKILDMNLSVMTSSYRDEEMKKVFVSRRLESALIHLSERFTYGLNLVLVLALAGVSLGVVGLFISDLMKIFQGDMEKGILSALGAMLILWMMIELLDNEIKNLKGGSFNILVFVGVIIVAIVREILISTLRHDDLKTQAFLTVTLLVLGVVYYLVSRAQKLKG
ncbi:MAG: protoglobin domain-containing protein [Trichlorobacter sp.]